MVKTEIFGKKNRIKKDKRENSKLWIGDDETMELGIASRDRTTYRQRGAVAPSNFFKNIK